MCDLLALMINILPGFGDGCNPHDPKIFLVFVCWYEPFFCENSYLAFKNYNCRYCKRFKIIHIPLSSSIIYQSYIRCVIMQL